MALDASARHLEAVLATGARLAAMDTGGEAIAAVDGGRVSPRSAVTTPSRETNPGHDSTNSGDSLSTSTRLGGLRALSAEDKARIGQLIKVLAQERRDKETCRQQLQAQDEKLRSLELERDHGRQQERELLSRVSRSLHLLRQYQVELHDARQAGRAPVADEAQQGQEAQAVDEAQKADPAPVVQDPEP